MKVFISRHENNRKAAKKNSIMCEPMKRREIHKNDDDDVAYESDGKRDVFFGVGCRRDTSHSVCIHCKLKEYLENCRSYAASCKSQVIVSHVIGAILVHFAKRRETCSHRVFPLPCALLQCSSHNVHFFSLWLSIFSVALLCLSALEHSLSHVLCTRHDDIIVCLCTAIRWVSFFAQSALNSKPFEDVYHLNVGEARL